MIDKIRTRTDLLVLKKLTVEHGHGVCRFFSVRRKEEPSEAQSSSGFLL